MTVFISYSHADRDWVSRFAAAIGAEGFDTWWDQDLLPGSEFRGRIVHALESASTVIVVWSKASLASRWVPDEAQDALNANKLIPVIKESVLPPHGFRQLQSADLSDWRGNADHAQFRNVVRALEAMGEPVRAGGGTMLDLPSRREPGGGEQAPSPWPSWRIPLLIWHWIVPLLILASCWLLYLKKVQSQCPSPVSPQCAHTMWDVSGATALLLLGGYVLLRLGEYLCIRATKTPRMSAAWIALMAGMLLALGVGTPVICYGLYGFAYVAHHNYTNYTNPTP
jgi:TIR domain-containing protein